MNEKQVEQAFRTAQQRYSEIGVDVDAALELLSCVALSIQCWQGDDVGGFETPEAALEGGGIAVTGNHPGKARTIDELQADLERALSLVPGGHRVNLHAMYGDFRGERVDRDQIRPEHFAGWVDWAEGLGIGLDFNATCFSHPLAEGGFTLSSPDERVRRFWIEHVQRCREIGAWLGDKLDTPCVHNLWIPDGTKDLTVSRLAHRELLKTSLDEIYAVKHPAEQLRDAVESKLFGLGSESFVVGSYDFYLAWAAANSAMLCLDMGHFHPTESVADKLSALLPFLPELLIHVSRGVRWDSDHVVLYGDELRELMLEIVRARALGRVYLALDFFDGSINRIGAWVIGARATLKALLFALLEPTDQLREIERNGELFARLGLLDEMKLMPLGAVWDYFCLKSDVPPAEQWIDSVREYERSILSQRG
ncbi:MAG: L-rhamnose isomerase [Candidatus Alcyoniella australis]|nr:L-rhamnose isomerase [Candidatus Alcyoniella australis]